MFIALIGTALRSWPITARSLWFDESFSWRLIQFPWTEIVSRTAADVHPPLYYFLLKAWSLVFGTSLLALRSFSVLGAAVTTIVIYDFTSSAFSRRAGILSAAFFALSAWQIPYAWEARMYTLGTALAVLSAWFLLKAVSSSSLKFWIGYVVSAAAFLYVHNFAIFTLFAQGIFLLIMVWQRKVKWISFASFLAIFILYLPWLPTLIGQTRQVQASYWVPPLTRWSLPDALYHFMIPTNQALAHSGPGLVFTLLPSVALILLLWFLLARPVARERPGALLTLLCFVVPIAAAISLSLVSQSVYQERFLVFAQLWFWVALAAVISKLRPRLGWPAAILICLALMAVFAVYWRELDIDGRPGVQAAVAEVEESQKSPEPVYVSSSFIFLPVLFYEGKPLAAPEAAKLVGDAKELTHFAGGPVILPSEIVSPAELAGSSAESLWLIDTTGFGGRVTELSAPWKLRDRKSFPEVYAYQGDVIVSQWARPH